MMNKQEFQKTIRNMEPPKHFSAITFKEAFNEGFNSAKNNALFDSCFLDEPERPVVPKYVADYYESIKDDFEDGVYELFIRLYNCDLDRRTEFWFDCADNKPIETLVKMKLFGYEVEKEGLYLASFRDTDQYLGWNEKLGEWFMSCSPFTSGVEQTQETWEGVGIWDNPAFEIKEVEE